MGASARGWGWRAMCQAIYLQWQTEKRATTEVVSNTFSKHKRSAASVVGGAYEMPHSCAGRSREVHGKWSGNGAIFRREERSVNTLFR